MCMYCPVERLICIDVPQERFPLQENSVLPHVTEDVQAV